MLLRINEGKNAVVGDRQAEIAKKFHAAGLLSKGGIQDPEGGEVNQRKMKGVNSEESPAA